DLVTQLLYTGNFEDYRTLLSQLGPDFYGELQAEMLRSNQRFAESLLGRRGYRFRQGGRALWFDYDSADTEHRRHDDYKRVLHRSNEVAMGYEFEWEEWTTG